MPQGALNRLLYHDPDRGRFDGKSLSDDQLRAMARNRETLALLTWEPFMHNPKLKHRLHRAGVPTLFLRGASDGVVSAAYLERYAALLPDARIETIAEAGHVPHLEQPEAVAARILKFLNCEWSPAAETGARS
jgi:pimeloyl-ACP methyl ester carboxylesterase